MNKANYILTSDGVFISQDELFHGRDIHYIDLDPDELMHWKYIKRVKLPNGKYRYYYDYNELNATKRKADEAKSNALMEQARVQLYNYHTENYVKPRLRAAVRAHNEEAETKASHDFRRSTSKAYAASKKQEEYEKIAKEYTQKYNSMKVTEFVAKNIVKGLNAISNLIYKLTHKKKVTKS